MKLQQNLAINYVEDSGVYEMLIYDAIGMRTENTPGYFATQFAEELSNIPRDANIKIRLNSRGGDLPETQTICSLLVERKGHVVCQIDGVCMSCATLIACASDSVRMKRGSLYMIHNPACKREGDIYAMLEGAQLLANYKDYALNAYCQKTGKDRAELSVMMDKGTFLGAEQALNFGFVDEVFDEGAVAYYPCELKNLDGIPAEFQSIFNNNHKNNITMDNKDPKPVEQATPAPQVKEVHTEKAPVMEASDKITMLNNKQSEIETKLAEMAALEKARQDRELEAKRNEITMLVQEAVKDGRIENTEQDTWIESCMSNPKMVAALGKLHKAERQEPIEHSPIMQGDISIKDIERRVEMFDKAGQSKEKFAFIMQHGDKLFKPLAEMAITVSSSLNRDTIFANAVTDFFKDFRGLLQCFSYAWDDIPREGNDTVQIPWVVRPNAADVVKDYNPAVGLETGNRQTNAVSIPLNKHKTVGLEYTSLDFQKYPYMKVYDHVRNMLDSLNEVVCLDILSVITSTNYTGVVDSNGVDPEDFDRTDIVAARKAAQLAMWPTNDRFLILNADYEAALLNDPSLATWAGMAEQGRDATRYATFGKLLDFTPVFNAWIPDNSEDLVGFICRREAIGIVGAPIRLTPELSQVCSYETIQDPVTGVTVGLQHWADATTRKVKHAFEILYGRAPVKKDSLIRFISAS